MQNISNLNLKGPPQGDFSTQTFLADNYSPKISQKKQVAGTQKGHPLWNDL